MNTNIPDTLTQKSRLAKRLTVEFRFQSGALNVEWDPAIPSPMPRQVFKRYQAARNDFMDLLAHQCQGIIATIDTDGEMTISMPPEVH